MTAVSSARRTPVAAPSPVRLAPGLRVVRRGRDLLQVGLHPERRLVLPRRPGTAHLLEQLGAELDGDREVAPAPAPAPVLDRLAERGLLVPTETPPPTRLGVRTSPPDASWPVELDPLLDGPAPPLRRVPSRPDAVLVLGFGEPDRTVLDPLVRDGVPHLVLTLVDGGARLGPLVVPGRTACLRCVDAHLATDDPDHLAVLTRYAAASRAARPDDVDPVLAGLVTSWALRDLALLHRGERRPATWSATLTWHPRSGTPVTRTWLRHPGCGCGWAAYDDTSGETGRPTRASGARPSGTMEA